MTEDAHAAHPSGQRRPHLSHNVSRDRSVSNLASQYGGPQAFFHTGWRFSRKALMPSTPSWVGSSSST